MSAPVRLFLSSAAADAALCAELVAHLKPLERQRVVEVWHDGRVHAGGEPATEALARLEAAEVVVLLVSPAFLASDRHVHEEAARALARRAAGEVEVVPVLVQHCTWEWTEFGKLIPLPRQAPVGAFPDRNQAWTEVARGLRAVAEGVVGRRPSAGGRRTLAAGLPRAERCIGRDAVVETLGAALLREPPERILLLGPAGIGKSTVSLAVLHQPKIVAHFGERRFFVPLDAAPDAEAATAALAAAVRVASGPDVWQRALSFLAAEPAVLVLDNLETPWDGEDQAGTEALLADLAALPELALVVSVRGAGRPGRVAWTPPLELRPLNAAEAEEMFCAIAGEMHRRKPGLSALLSLQEGVPLAIALLAHAAQGNDLINLQEEWEARRTAVLERDSGARNRLRSWKASLELSLGSPRMTAGARRLLSVLALLPDGIAQRDLAALQPGAGPAAARALAQVGLAYFEGGRLKMLSPVREYVKAVHQPSVEDHGRAMEHYGELARTLGPVPGRTSGAEAAVRLAAETANVDAMIRCGLEEAGTERWMDAAVALTRFARFSGNTVPLSLGRALEVARRAGDRRREATCIESLGDIARARSQHEDARARYDQALPLYRQVGYVLGEANCIKSLGDIARARSQHEDARARYDQALPLYRQVGHALGEANCIRSLGDIARARSQHEEARVCYDQALPLYRQVGHVLGEANCFQSLGDIARARSQHEDARAYYDQALPLYRQAGNLLDVLGEANCIRSLGDIALARSQHEDASARYDQALPLYQKVGDMLGEANCIQGLGDIALARSQHDEARARYDQALPLYQQVGDVLGEANCIKRLGDIALARLQHDEARARYDQALPLYQQVGAVLSKANCIKRLGDIALARLQHDEARARYDEALPLYRHVGNVLGEANCIQGLGDIALARSQHEEARARYDQALPLYQQVGNVRGEANCIMSLGAIAFVRNDANAARAHYEQSLALYQRIQDPYSIGWIHGQLALIAASDSAGQHRDVEAARSGSSSLAPLDFDVDADRTLPGDL
ncbi:tetratricopeptide repeat protein [Sorangium sp. So ce726]|uniref:tetratricopeptide repeat protein n=1 Tax=Sorangium sp. So ce726 TaxID=3133319 RepID=UPI003F5E6A8A